MKTFLSITKEAGEKTYHSLTELYESFCKRYFGKTISEIVRQEQKENPWIFVMIFLIIGALVQRYYAGIVVHLYVAVFIGILIGHFWFNSNN